MADRAALLVSELVTNAVLHGGLGPRDEIEIEVTRNTKLRIEVIDPGSGFALGLRDSDGVGGWGLVLVERLADRWGIVRNAETRVWFELGAE